MDMPISPRRKKLQNRQVHVLKQIEKKLLWLSAWTIHNANHIRPNRDGLKVGGHQASCASSISILTALYMHIARPQDRIAVKPHAGPVFHAINYLFGRQTAEKLKGLRQMGGIPQAGERADLGAGPVERGIGPRLGADEFHGFGRLAVADQFLRLFEGAQFLFDGHAVAPGAETENSSRARDGQHDDGDDDFSFHTEERFGLGRPAGKPGRSFKPTCHTVVTFF